MKQIKEYKIKESAELNALAKNKVHEDLDRMCDLTVEADLNLTENQLISLGICLGRKIFDSRQSIFRVESRDVYFYFVESLDGVRESLFLCRDAKP